MCVAPSRCRTGRAHPHQKRRTLKFQKLTPNLVVRDVAASMEFYRSVLGFQTAITGPEQPPFVFGSVAAGGREISFNDQKAIPEDCPALGAKPIGGSALRSFMEVEGIDEVLAAIQKSGAQITMRLKQQFHSAA